MLTVMFALFLCESKLLHLASTPETRPEMQARCSESTFAQQCALPGAAGASASAELAAWQRRLCSALESSSAWVAGEAGQALCGEVR